MASSETDTLYKSLTIFEQPLCLVSTTDGKFEVEENVLRQLQQIEEGLVIISIVGLYRTGKSFLMNRLFGKMTGFPLGNTTLSKTKGIWIWCKPHPTEENRVMVLLDTEGLGDPKRGSSTYDNEICTLATLLCNVLVYNMLNVFDTVALNKLVFVSEMSKLIQFKNKFYKNEEKDQLHVIAPTFVLCLRDFSLKMVKGDQQLTEDEYLEYCLELQEGEDENIQRANRTRECVRTYFTRRKCFTFDRPGGRSVLNNMEEASVDDLSEDFLSDTNKFCDYVYTCRPKVFLNSKYLNGTMFATLVEEYVKAIRNKAIPDVDDAFTVVSKMENERMVVLAVDKFKNEIQSIELPILNMRTFDDMFYRIKYNALTYLRSQAIFESEIYENKAIAEMDRLWGEERRTNLEFVSKVCTMKFIEMYDETIGKNVKEKKYAVVGGYKIYRDDIEQLKANFKTTMAEVDQNIIEHTLFDFMEREEETSREILMVDDSLAEDAKKLQIEQMKRSVEESLNQLEHRKKKLQDDYKEKERELEEKRLEERREDRVEKERLMSRIVLLSNVQRENNEHQCRLMNEQIRNSNEQLERQQEQLRSEEKRVNLEKQEQLRSEEKRVNLEKQRIQLQTQEMNEQREIDAKRILQMQKQTNQNSEIKNYIVEQNYKTVEQNLNEIFSPIINAVKSVASGVASGVEKVGGFVLKTVCAAANKIASWFGF